MRTIIRGARLIDGTGVDPIPQASIEVSEGKVSRVGRQMMAPDQCSEVIDVDGKTVLPGFIDAHVHLAWAAGKSVSVPDLTLTALSNAQCALRHGITTLRDVGAVHGIPVAIRRAVMRGQVLGPRLLCSAGIVCMTGGHGWEFGGEADGVDGVLRAVRKQIREGADFIKVCTTHRAPRPEFSQSEMDALVTEAHRLGRKVACHAGVEPGYGIAVRAGVDSIEHGAMPSDDTLQEMVERGTALVPTLTVMGHGFSALNRYGQPPIKLSELLEDSTDDYDDALAYFDQSIIRLPEVLKYAVKNRIPIGAGTDAPLQNLPFYSLIYEMELLVKYGLTPMQSLMAATSVNARVLGIADKTGAIRPGLDADIVVIDGDPLEDITRVRNVDLVLRRGRLVPEPSPIPAPYCSTVDQGR